MKSLYTMADTLCESTTENQTCVTKIDICKGILANFDKGFSCLVDSYAVDTEIIMCKQVIQRENISSSQIHTATIDQRDSQQREKNFTFMFTSALNQESRSNYVTTSLLTPAERCQWRWPGFRDRRTREAETERRLESKLLNSIVSLDLLDSWCKRHVSKHLRRDVDSDGQGFETAEPEKRKHGEGNRATNY